MAGPIGSITNRAQQMKEALEGSNRPAQPAYASPIFGMTPRPNPQWNPAGGWPGAGQTGQIWDRMRQYQQLPTGFADPTAKSFMDYWKPYTPPAGLPLPEHLKEPAGRELSWLEDFNVGPQMASVPLGEGAGPSAPWAGWQPAQEEGWSGA